jgi:hypothetical protein
MKVDQLALKKRDFTDYRMGVPINFLSEVFYKRTI